MKRLLFLLPLVLMLGSCSFFDKDVKPALTCAGKVVPLADITRVEQDLTPPPNYVDLAELCATAGWDIGACIIDDVKTKKPALGAAADEFKRQHAVEIRSAQPVSARTPSEARPKIDPLASRWPADQDAKYSYLGETVAAAASRCDRACAPGDGVGSPGQSCLCQRVDRKNWRNTRWVILPSSPPGLGSGAAGGGGSIVASSR
jgi:hypothetical protein